MKIKVKVKVELLVACWFPQIIAVRHIYPPQVTFQSEISPCQCHSRRDQMVSLGCPSAACYLQNINVACALFFKSLMPVGQMWTQKQYHQPPLQLCSPSKIIELHHILKL